MEETVIRVKRIGAEGTFGDPVDMKADEAVEELLGGSAILDQSQADPPFVLLKVLGDRAGDEKVFGPELNTAELVQRATSALVTSGVRQTIVEGLPVRWVASGADTLNLASAHILQTGAGDMSIREQLRTALDCYLESRAVRIQANIKWTEADMKSRCLIGGKLANFVDRSWAYKKLVPQWYQYREALNELDSKITGVVRRGLAGGRVLCCVGGGSESRCLHPTQATFPHRSRAKAKALYCFSSDLPKAWFKKGSGLNTRRRAAAKWMSKVYSGFKSQGRLASAGDLQSVAQKKFDLSEHAAKKAWQSISAKLKPRLGNIPARMRVSIDEIMKIS